MSGDHSIFVAALWMLTRWNLGTKIFHVNIKVYEIDILGTEDHSSLALEIFLQICVASQFLRDVNSLKCTE